MVSHKKTKNKAALIATVVLCLIVVLSACGGNEKGANSTISEASATSSASASSPALEEASSAPAEDVELTMAQWGTAEQVAATQTVLDKFTEKHPNIKVNLVYKDWGTYWTWLTTQAASKDLPDVYKMSFAYVDKYAKLGAMAELDGLISSTGLDLGQFEQPLLAMHQSGGKQVSLPRDANTVVMYYNKDLFDAAGLDYPASEMSWEEVLPLALKLTLDKNGNNAESPDFNPKKIEQWGIVVDAAGMGDAVLEPQLWSNGARLVDDNNKLALDTPEAQEVLQFFRDLTEKYHVNPAQSTIQGLGGNPILAFGTGKIGLAFGGSWSATDFAKASFKFDVMLPPKFKEVTSVVQPAGYAMSPNTKKQEAAFALISYLVGEEGQTEMAKLNDGLPANKAAAAAYLANDVGFNQKLFLDAQAKSIPAAWYDGKDRLFWEFIPQKLALAFQGQTDTDKAVKEIENLMNNG